MGLTSTSINPPPTANTTLKNQAYIRLRHRAGQNSQQNHARRSQRVRKNSSGPLPGFVNKLDGGRVRDELRHEVHHNQAAEHGVRKPELFPENDEQDGRQVDDKRLGDIAQITGAQGAFIIHAVMCSSHEYIFFFIFFMQIISPSPETRKKKNKKAQT